MKTTANAPWTPELIARLEQLVGDGVPFAAIGIELGITKNAAVGRAKRMGLKPRADVRLNGRQTAPRKAAESRQRQQKAPALEVDFPERGECVWPHGHPGEAGFHFCADAVAKPGVPYCPTHFRVAYVAIVKRTADVVEIRKAAA